MFIKKQKDLRVEKHKQCVQKYLDTRGKLGKIYWYIIINLLKLKSATCINIIITIGQTLVSFKNKFLDRKG